MVTPPPLGDYKRITEVGGTLLDERTEVRLGPLGSITHLEPDPIRPVEVDVFIGEG